MLSTHVEEKKKQRTGKGPLLSNHYISSIAIFFTKYVSQEYKLLYLYNYLQHPFLTRTIKCRQSFTKRVTRTD